jgi:protein ImuA
LSYIIRKFTATACEFIIQLENKTGTCYSNHMITHLLTRRPHRQQPGLPLVGDITLPRARVHEFCGPSRRVLALIAARQVQGPIFWICAHWQGDRLCGDGVQPWLNPGRITFVTPKRLEDILWCMEEVLRAGCVPLVVAELPAPPALTPIRRLHLAAETGAKMDKPAPIGLLLTPGDGGAQGVESRWHMTPQHSDGHSRWMLQRRRARMAPPAIWALDWAQAELTLSAGIQSAGI